ncbi:MAG: DUF2783 domain-containing protein [Roseitalea sp.]|nr:DUF2783 domain-containing protein [Roseitalea sp.]MBO6950925.1 DUF2783 domain-containing protein [Rhizobiaceae bacterium]MBO6591088.1 DUF2783 domain-containing protein [Roseitalea sp.]MBO6599654.1 DUF2783 domain-containing protein [Roseitalea sp.]MBO6613905.1 DUF2783 domain-containing protein [Roseitalea sp.]
MGELNTEPAIDAPDDLYAELLAMHEGLSKADSDAVNARLILVLMNQIADRDVLRRAMAAARIPGAKRH